MTAARIISSLCFWIRARPGICRSAAAWGAVLLFAALTLPARAQMLSTASGVASVSTVRENEFRSRWADYQVDRPPQAVAQQTEDNTAVSSGGLMSALGKSFSDHFRDGPLQFRADLSAGWEFTNEKSLQLIDPKGTDNSPFASPAFGLFYNLELGPATVSARYSLGYVYYLDQSYFAANHNGGILSQTGGLDLGFDFTRGSIRSSTSGSYGNGNDIESGTFRDRLTISEALDGAYLLTDFTQLGASASLGYTSYSGGGSTDTTQALINGTVYGDYVITGKSRLRLEIGAGDDHQSAGAASTSDRTYYQFLLRINYVPSTKLSLDGGLGWGFQQDSAVVNRGSDNHPIYTITIRYVPTEKTSASFHVGYEGTDLKPDLSFQVQWQPRLNTALGLSVYQNNNFSTFVVAQTLTTRGVLATVQQKFFEKVEIDLGAGVEQTIGYTGTATSRFDEPYYFAIISLLWQINSALALQGYYRAFSGEPGMISAGQGWQSRASLSLRLTF